MSAKMKSNDPDIRGSFPALKRAAKRARQRAIATGTPLYVMQGAKIVDLNLARKQASKRTA